MSQAIDNLLAHLDKVRRTGKDRYIACCPAHGDKNPSLMVSERDDGSVGIFCFSGCSAHEIVSAVGLELSDLFPPSETHHKKSLRQAFSAADALRCLSFEGMVIAAAGRSFLSGKWNESEQSRLVDAVGRINAAMTACGVRP